MNKRRKVMIRSAVLAFVVVCATASAHAYTPQAELAQVERDVAGRFGDVRQITLQAFDQLRARPGQVVVIDVREPAEFAVSRIAGAVRVDPEATAEQAKRVIGPPRADRTVVLYCTIGFRSSRLAQRIQSAYRGAGAPTVVSLRGGIIAWSNAGRALVNDAGATVYVHPYDDRRRLLLARPDRASLTARR